MAVYKVVCIDEFYTVARVELSDAELVGACKVLTALSCRGTDMLLCNEATREYLLDEEFKRSFSNSEAGSDFIFSTFNKDIGKCLVSEDTNKSLMQLMDSYDGFCEV